MIEVPERFLGVPYKGAHYPGSPKTDGLVGGANCQTFAYELLKHFGLNPPQYRSSEFWADEEFTERVEELQPLDLLLWNKTLDAWGAHVGVYLGERQAIHLSKEVGESVIWSMETFLEQPLYRVFIGAKRVARR